MPSISQLPSWRTPKTKNINKRWIFTEGAFFILSSVSRNVHSVDKQGNIRQGNPILP